MWKKIRIKTSLLKHCLKYRYHPDVFDVLLVLLTRDFAWEGRNFRHPDIASTPEALAILSDTTVRRSAAERENLKPYWKSQKKPHFSRWSKSLLYTSFSKILVTTERRLTRW